jgi:hypothetical protein
VVTSRSTDARNAPLITGSTCCPTPRSDWATIRGWDGEVPLWFYILKEVELLYNGERLGPVGGRIMAETLVGLLQRDPNSYLYLDAA